MGSHVQRTGILCLISVLIAAVLNTAVLCNGGDTSSFVRKAEKSGDMPLDSDVFAVPPGYNAPQQVSVHPPHLFLALPFLFIWFFCVPIYYFYCVSLIQELYSEKDCCKVFILLIITASREKKVLIFIHILRLCWCCFVAIYVKSNPSLFIFNVTK